MQKKDITGCRFSLYPVYDNYDTTIEALLDTLEKTDKSKIWSLTDHMSTTYRGKQIHVMDCLRTAFCYLWSEEVHMTAEYTFSVGSPDETGADCVFDVDDVPCNGAHITNGDFLTYAKVSFYSLGEQDYGRHDAHVADLAKTRGIATAQAHYVTMLKGSAAELFDYFGDVLNYARENLSHCVFQVTLSVNSPSPVKVF